MGNRYNPGPISRGKKYARIGQEKGKISTIFTSSCFWDTWEKEKKREAKGTYTLTWLSSSLAERGKKASLAKFSFREKGDVRFLNQKRWPSRGVLKPHKGDAPLLRMIRRGDD